LKAGLEQRSKLLLIDVVMTRDPGQVLLAVDSRTLVVKKDDRQDLSLGRLMRRSRSSAFGTKRTVISLLAQQASGKLRLVAVGCVSPQRRRAIPA
jgi:hypothetical protein